jgi:hypothetical protein
MTTRGDGAVGVEQKDQKTKKERIGSQPNQLLIFPIFL